jgi:hypothetical protein
MSYTMAERGTDLFPASFTAIAALVLRPRDCNARENT